MSIGRSHSVQQLTDRRYLVSGFADALSVLSDRRLSNDPSTGEDLHPDITTALVASQRRSTSMQLCDAPRHTQLRRAVAGALTPRRYDAPLARMERRAEKSLEALLARGGGDLVSEFILPLVFSVICDLLGVPEVDRERVLAWSEDSTMPDPEVSTKGGSALDAYLSSLLEAKAEGPDEDLLSELAAARQAGRLSDSEAVGTASLMLVAGYETTVSFLSTSALTLMMAPRLRQGLEQRPELLPPTIEEMFRYITPTRGAWIRFATEDVPIGDTVIPAGSAVVVDFASANRDPRRFGTPDRLDPSRGDKKHLAFGHGPHYCPGATLARRQAHIVLKVLVPRLAALRLAAPVSEMRWHQNRFSRRPQSLQVTVAVSDSEVTS
ncbi:cytochrome P450 [Rhodococcus daqingensis]|uniref:Cytochrome P450 n=1 Tax=Rhodococcus daqingensis TaxID=2479363 RepID=A0ABW2S0B2_9NOCA